MLFHYLILLVIFYFLFYYTFGSKEKIEIVRESEINSTIKEINASYYSKKLVLRYISKGLNETYYVETFLFQNEDEGKKFMEYFFEETNDIISNKEPIKISDFEGNIATFSVPPNYGLIIRKNGNIVIAGGPTKKNLIKVVEWVIRRY